MGLMGNQKNKKIRINGVLPKVKELVSSAKYIPTLFICVETKLKFSHKRIKLPKDLRYLGETSGQECKAGIFVFHDKNITIEDRANDVRVISSQYAMYLKVKHGDKQIEIICVYLPCETNHCIQILSEIENFIELNNIRNFVFIGDMNIDFAKYEHRRKASTLYTFLMKYQLYNLAVHLNKMPDFTWVGRGKRAISRSNIDHCYMNFKLFNKISFNFNSFSDHKTLTVGFKKDFIYHPPQWKQFLFKDKEFIELMKKESISFLINNADNDSISHEFEHYFDEEGIVDAELTFENLEYKNTSVLFTLIQHLKLVHDQYYSRLRLKNFQKTADFDHQISKLYDDFSKANDPAKLLEIRSLIESQQEYFRNLVYVRAETSYIKNLILDGKSNSFTFRHIRKAKKHEFNINIGGTVTNDLPTIANHFANLHAEIVSPEIVPQSKLDELLQEYELSLDEIFPKIETLSSPFSSIKEFKEVINSMSNNSSPGISSEPKHLYSFLFDFFPSFTTDALNNMYCIDLNNSPFRIIKDRNMISIPKKDCDLSIGSNFRPISLLETIYKILSKAIKRKVSPYLNEILPPDQFGFSPGKHMHTASVSIIATMNHIKSHNIDAQFVSFDIRKAFDMALPEVCDRIIKHIFPVGDFAKAWINITSGGRFRAKVGNYFSSFFKLKRSTAQGDPSSGDRFNFLQHIFSSCLNSKPLQNISLKIGNKHLPVGMFADDTWKFCVLKSDHDTELIHRLLERMEESIGLKINFDKTKILVHGNSFPNNLNLLGKVHSFLKHLGIFLSFDTQMAANLTYNELFDRMDNKAKRFPMHFGDNILKRRNLCVSLMNSMAYHIFRVYTPTPKQCEKLWKIISKFLWSSKTNGDISYRFKVSQKRIQLDFCKGGLKILKPEEQSFSIFLPSLLNVLRHAQQFPNSSLGILLSHKHVPITFVLKNFGLNTFLRFKRCIKSLYPSTNQAYFQKIPSFLEELEKDSETFLQTSLISCSWTENLRFFSNRERLELGQNNLTTIASILDHRKIGEKILILPILKSDTFNQVLSNSLMEKLLQLVDKIKVDFPQLAMVSAIKYKMLLKSIIDVNNFQPSQLSFHFKRLHKAKVSKTAPSIATRIRDGLYFPDIESFENSFMKVMSLPIIIYYKAFFFEQFCRTLVSKNKLFKFGHADSNLCQKCKCVSTIEHSLFICRLPKYVIHALATFLDQKYNNGCPDFIFLKENFFLFNIFYEHFTESEYTQLTLFILVAKDRFLKSSTEDYIEKWNYNNYYAQTLLMIQFTFKMLIETALDNDLIVSFQEFMLSWQDNMSYFDR